MYYNYTNKDWMSTGYIKKDAQVLVPDDNFTQPIDVLEVIKNSDKNIIVTTIDMKTYDASEIRLHKTNETDLEVYLMATTLIAYVFTEASAPFLKAFQKYARKVKITPVPFLTHIIQFQTSMLFVLDNHITKYWQPMHIGPYEATSVIEFIKSRPDMVFLVNYPTPEHKKQVQEFYMASMKNAVEMRDKRSEKIEAGTLGASPFFEDPELKLIRLEEAKYNWAAMWLSALPLGWMSHL
jgi:hypothetical protein